MILLDVNVLLALADAVHTHHSLAKKFVQSRLSEAWVTCHITENGFIQVISGRTYANPLEHLDAARLLLKKMIQSAPGYQFWADDVSRCDTNLFPTLPPSEQLTDCWLLALAVKRGGKFASNNNASTPLRYAAVITRCCFCRRSRHHKTKKSAKNRRFCLPTRSEPLGSPSVFLSKTRCAVGALVRNGHKFQGNAVRKTNQQPNH